MESNNIRISNLTIEIPSNFSDEKNKTPSSFYDNILIIFDESGSMGSMGIEPVDGVNAFIEGQRESLTDIQVTFVKFSDNIKIVYKNVPITNVKKIEYKSYIPNGMTALYDSIGKCFLDKLKSVENKNVIVLIMTDGEDNASKMFSKLDIKLVIKNAEDNFGWKVIFMGSNFDVEKTGSDISINNERCVEYDQTIPGNFLNICRSTSDCVKTFRNSRSSSENIELKIPRHQKTNKKMLSPLPPIGNKYSIF